MSTYTLAEAKAQLSRLISLAEAGEEISITKRGRAVVKLVPSEPARKQMSSLAEHRAQMTPQTESAGEFIRKLRESDRY
ncbi:type II toxin-antitoxin system Phd/YefM family antitoxin [Massilia sp. TSP1-1-2]|uniref:type II toxin-antitoxin system Phd/YefM family antitoxin n=1 Tax=unclassified Massilia TaxID=2609279 RepID=UPI003CF01B7B